MDRDALRKLRKSMRLTQSQMAGLIRIPVATVKDVEAGIVDMPGSKNPSRGQSSLTTSWLAGLALFLTATTASAQSIVPIQDVASLAGKWRGSGGLGAPGHAPTVLVEQTNNPDGTYEAVVTLYSGERVPVKGTMKALPDGTVAYDGLSNTGIYRLYVIGGQRVIRAEARNKKTGAVSWAELTEAK